MSSATVYGVFDYNFHFDSNEWSCSEPILSVTLSSPFSIFFSILCSRRMSTTADLPLATTYPTAHSWLCPTTSAGVFVGHASAASLFNWFSHRFITGGSHE